MCQIPWTVYYAWIKNCNTVIKMGAGNPTEEQKSGVGIAYAMRAFFYEDMAQMYANETYTKNPEAETVPIVSDDESIDMNHNPRATNEKMWNFIISDLDKAEEYLAGYERPDKTTRCFCRLWSEGPCVPRNGQMGQGRRICQKGTSRIFCDVFCRIYRS